MTGEQFKNKLRFQRDYIANRLFVKKDQVLICEPSHLETNCIEVANYVSKHYEMRVAVGIPKNLIVYAKKLLSPGVEIVDQDSRRFKFLYYTSKYIFTTRWRFPRFYSNKQVVLNLWHGVPLKKIGLMMKDSGMFADYTLATSEMTKKIFAQAFGVAIDTVIIAGYPRNDLLLRAQADRVSIKRRLEGNLPAFNKIMIWLPTFRVDTTQNDKENGLPADNPFQIHGFDSDAFNKQLARHNVLCIVKPHPHDYHRSLVKTYSNIRVINDEWMLKQGITLYHLTACTDILISDLSSIILDYLLLDQPVICFSTDVDEYKKNRGFVFDDIENWLPSMLLRNQAEFTIYLEGILSTGIDPWEKQRKALKSAFFKFHDANSTKRLLEHVFNARK
jgi:CDP-glycerol glycerophosphotransferase